MINEQNNERYENLVTSCMSHLGIENRNIPEEHSNPKVDKTDNRAMTIKVKDNKTNNSLQKTTLEKKY